MKRISVFGSCVCRDLFEKNSNDYSFHTDIRFVSPISLFSPSIKGLTIGFDDLKRDVKDVGGNWYKKNLINDLNKTTLSALSENHGDYLIIDLAESRISLVDISFKNTYEKLRATYSVSFRGHYFANLSKNALKNAKLEIINPLFFSDSYWKKVIRELANEMQKLFKEDNIILIKNMPAEQYIDSFGYLHPYSSDDHFDNIILCKILLPKLYSFFIENCPNCKVIEIPRYALGNEKHKWGNHPFHFTQVYYDYLLECVNSIVLDNDYDKVNDVFIRYSLLFEKEYENAIQLTALKNGKTIRDYDVFNILNEHEGFKALGKKQKALILLALDKKNFFKNLKKLIKE